MRPCWLKMFWQCNAGEKINPRRWMCWPYWSITQTYQFTFILYIRVRSCSAEQLVTEGLQSVSSALGFKSAYNWLVCLLMLWLSHGQWNWTTEYNGTKLPMSQILKKAYLIFFPSTSFTVMFRRSALLLHTEKSRLLMRAGPVRPLFILAVCLCVRVHYCFSVSMSGVPVVLVTVAEGSERSPLRNCLNWRG